MNRSLSFLAVCLGIFLLVLSFTTLSLASPAPSSKWNYIRAQYITQLEPKEFSGTGVAQAVEITPTTKKIQFVNHSTTGDWFININGAAATANGQHSVRIVAGATLFVDPLFTDSLSVIDDGTVDGILQTIYHRGDSAVE